MSQHGFLEEKQILAEPRPVEQWSERLAIRNLLCAVDFTEYSHQALQYSIEIARHFGSHLIIQHILAAPSESFWSEEVAGHGRERTRSDRRNAEEDLRRLQNESDIDDLNVTYLLGEGVVRTQILQTVSQKKVDLLVLGTHARRGIKRWVEGSLAERLVHEAVCPVLVVSRPSQDGNGISEPSAPRVRTVLLATDFSRNSDRALTYALRWAAEWSGRVILLHTVETGSKAMQPLTDLLPEADATLETRVREAWEKLRILVPDPAHAHCQLEYEVRDGNPGEQIVDCAREKKADLIVMGARGLGRASFTWGSTLSDVVRDGRFPVLALRQLGA